MPRPATGSRDRIVAATLALLRRGGLSAAGLNDVVAHAAAPKGSLYHYFPGGKTALVIAALETYREMIARIFETSLAGGKPLAQRVRALFRVFALRMAEDDYTRSCAVGAVTLDVTGDDDHLRTTCAETLEHWAQVAANHLPELPARQRLPAARLLVTLVEGAQLAARAQRGPQPLEAARDAFVRHVESVAAI